MQFSLIQVAKEPPLATITLNRPDALNALNSALAGEIMDALDDIERDDTVVCVLLSGSEKAFSVGADIKEMAAMTAAEQLGSSRLFALWNRVGRFPKPIVAALSGHVLGGGLELAMCCDVLIASETTRLGQPEINIGIIPGGGGTQRLPRAIGKYKAMEMILAGTFITAEEAKAVGLVNRIVPVGQFLSEARKVALDIASKPPLAVKLAKEAIVKSQETSLRDGLDLERQLVSILFSSEDKAEGMKAFLEKRKPHFTGR